MSDITQALEQDAIADTLVAPLHSTYESQDEAVEYRAGDAEDGVDYGMDQPSDEVGEVALAATDNVPEATPEQRQAFAQEMQQLAALPQEQQAARADEYLKQGYESAFGSISPDEAKAFTDSVGAQWGNENLSAIVDPLEFATFAETWSNNVERTIALHPNGPAFMQALSDDPQTALELAAGMCDPVMTQRFFDHFQNLVGNAASLEGRNPLQFAAECILDVAKLQGWGARSQSEERTARRSGFQTNTDIFDDETLDHFRRL